MGKAKRAAGKTGQIAADLDSPALSGVTVWLRAEYHAHTFHYRMPETVAIAAVSPLIPSPLTVKMALVAALARTGNVEGEMSARAVAAWLPQIEAFALLPPEGVATFKAFMRYVRPPANPTSQDSNTGGFYAVSPHIREYALWQGKLGVLIHAPKEAEPVLTQALWDIAYLGAKDSQVTCWQVETLPDAPDLTFTTRLVSGSDLSAANGPIFRYADFNSAARPTLETLIPFSREKRDYQDGFYMLPGALHGSGRAKIYRRADMLPLRSGQGEA